MPGTKLEYRFPWTNGATAGSETMSLLDGLITGTIYADAANARYRARFEPFQLGIFDTAEQAKAAVEQKASEMINTLLATVLPAELKAWLHHT